MDEKPEVSMWSGLAYHTELSQSSYALHMLIQFTQCYSTSNNEIDQLPAIQKGLKMTNATNWQLFLSCSGPFIKSSPWKPAFHCVTITEWKQGHIWFPLTLIYQNTICVWFMKPSTSLVQKHIAILGIYFHIEVCISWRNILNIDGNAMLTCISWQERVQKSKLPFGSATWDKK